MRRPQVEESSSEVTNSWAAILEVHRRLAPSFPHEVLYTGPDRQAISDLENATLSPSLRIRRDSDASEASRDSGVPLTYGELERREEKLAKRGDIFSSFQAATEKPSVAASDSPPLVDRPILTPVTPSPESHDHTVYAEPSPIIGTVTPPGNVSPTVVNGIHHDINYIYPEQVNYSGLPLYAIPATINPAAFINQLSFPYTAAITALEHKARINILRQRLSEHFPADARSLSEPLSALSDPEGIHIFIDYSNIWICYSQAVKVRAGRSRYQRMAIPPFSIEALITILERGRAAAKRVLVGSCEEGKDHDREVFHTAKALGYEALILARVFKSKEPKSSAESSDEVPPPHPKYHEQGVDEVLQLHMSHSIMDARPGTLVLVTGDGSPAEYSDGFKMMVDRALRAGWKVELVAWGLSISMVYRDREFRGKWGEKFTIIRLDEYLDALMDVGR